MTLVRRALLYFNTVRHLRPLQIAARPWHVGRYAAYRAAPVLAEVLYPEPSADEARRAGPIIALAPGERIPPCLGLDEAMARAEAIVRGEVEYQRVRGRAVPPVDWAPRDRPKLWRYHLHYFDEALDLGAAYRATGDRRFFAAFRALAEDWIAQNPVAQGDGWEPYPVATRTTNWLAALDLFAGCDPVFEERATRSAARQALFLVPNHLEEHLLGNHLLRNLCAACVASYAFAGPRWESLRDWSLALVRREVGRQVVGEFHCELTPSYHAIALADLESVACAAERRGNAPDWLRAAVAGMAGALQTILHPDGDLPLLNDTALGHGPRAQHLLDPRSLRSRIWGALSPGGAAAHQREAGLFTAREGGEFLIFDHGRIGPPEQPGHAHSDTLGFELSHAGRRALVDSGVGTYEAGGERAYFRSALAHNVVTVDLQSPDEMWAAFRVARRSRPGPWRVDERDGATHVRAELRAYQGWRQVRDLVWDPQAGLAVRDRVHGANKGAVRTHLHLHPSLDARREGDAWTAGDLRIEKLRGREWEAFRGHEGPPRRGFYAERLGATQPAWELALRAEPGDPSVAAYAVSWVPGWKDRAAAILDGLDRE